MADTDNLLKRLVSMFVVDFASWLLGTPVRTAQALPSELPGTTAIADQVFQITLADGRDLLFHLEFQGRRSHLPMPWRMLDYMPRLAAQHRLAMENVVLYVGRGAGADDSGVHEVVGLDGSPVLAWRYRVVRLWQLRAEELLATGQVAPLVLIGQTQITTPKETLAAVVARMRQVAAGEHRVQLLAALVALLPAEEMVKMVENLLAEEDLLEELDLPYLRRLREKALTEGRAEGLRAGEAGILLRLLRTRFGTLPVEVEARISTADAETLLRWSERVLTAPSLESVLAP
jgi:predicted transposase YdaD